MKKRKKAAPVPTTQYSVIGNTFTNAPVTDAIIAIASALKTLAEHLPAGPLLHLGPREDKP